MAEAALHFAPSGATLAVCDGPELLVYGGDGGPRWKHFCDGILVGVRVCGDTVLTLDSEGRLNRFRMADGQLKETVEVGAPGLALDATAGGLALVRTPDELVLVEGTSTMPLNQGATSAATFGSDRSRIGVGWANGTFRAFDLASGEVGELELGDPITAVAWSPRGCWIVAAGMQLHVIGTEAQEIGASIALQTPTTHLAANPEGIFVAGLVGHNQVFVADLHHNKVHGTADFKRDVIGVGWGPRGLLAIGLDDGDATRLDVYSGGSIRTEPHPGRGRNSWSYTDHLDRAALRGAAAFARAGETPIARYEGAKDDGWSWWSIALLLFGLSMFTCLGCTGCGGLLWYLRGMGLI